MAKVQSFADKLKKKKGDTKINIKVIKWYQDPERNTMRTLERMVKVDEVGQVEELEITK